MRFRSIPDPIDRRVADLARRQWGVVSREQLLALGMSAAAITRRLRAGRLHPIHAGVYAVGHAVPRIEATWMAVA